VSRVFITSTNDVTAGVLCQLYLIEYSTIQLMRQVAVNCGVVQNKGTLGSWYVVQRWFKMSQHNARMQKNPRDELRQQIKQISTCDIHPSAPSSPPPTGMRAVGQMTVEMNVIFTARRHS